MLHKEMKSTSEINLAAYDAEFEEMATDVIYKSNLAEFADAVEELTNTAIAKRINTENVISDIFNDIAYRWEEDIYDMTTERFQIVEKDSSLRMFLHTQWACYRAEAGDSPLDSCYMDMLLLRIEESRRQTTDENGMATRISQVTKILESETAFFKMLPSNHIIAIVPLDLDETCYEGATLIPSRVCHQILVSNFAGEETQRDSIFELLVSLGKVLLATLMDSPNACVKRFSEVMELLKDTAIEQEHKDDIMMLFAESFAASLCTLPGLEQYDRYPNISFSVKQKIYEYMIQLACRKRRYIQQ